MNQYLRIKENNAAQRIFDLVADKYILGRQADCTIVLADPLASRNHCSIERSGSSLVLRDLGSRNGTLVNGRRVEETRLKSGDIIRIAGVELTFVEESEASSDSEQDADDGVEGTMDVLTEDDLLGAFDAPISAPTPMAIPSDPEVALQQLVDSLPDKSLAEADVTFLNSRAQPMHNDRSAGRKGKRDAVELFRLTLLACVRSHATDIHLEPHQNNYGLRLRVDGSLVDVATMPSQLGQKISALVKILADIDIAQRNSLQEGRFSARVPSRRAGSTGKPRRIDYRVSLAPAVYGQKLVIRILDEENAPLLLGDLHMPRWMQEELSEQMSQDAGMVLVSGPTGSGKTTTLYSLLRSIDSGQRNVMTIEDPVEMQLDRVTQMPVDDSQGKSFSTILRSVLRQDPDVIMLGEIRDAETARTAMQAANTGHMVLSTIHTRDTLGTIFRLIDLGVEPYMISQGLSIVVAQRLVRQLCPFCRQRVEITDLQKNVMAGFGFDWKNVHAAYGCPKCLGTGHAGRRGVFELLRSNQRLKDCIQRSVTSTAELMKAMEGTQFVTLAKSGYRLVADGSVGFEEVQRIAEKETGRGND